MKKTQLHLLYMSCYLMIIPIFSGCSSGGNGSDEDLAINDSCSIIGAKIAGGRECKDASGTTSSLIKLNFVDSYSVGTCTGTAIGKRAVLTAAHCFVESFNYILVETEKTAQETTHYSLADFRIVGDRHNNVLYNDVAIVFVDRDLGVPIVPVVNNSTVAEGEEVVIAGFGEAYEGGTTGDLYAGKALISDVTSNHLFITYKSGQSHPCRGDSGGPMLVKVGSTWAIAGTVSQSDPSVAPDNICSEGDVTLYTNLQNSDVASFLRAKVPDIKYE